MVGRYEFTVEWAAQNFETWAKVLAPIVGKPGVRGLEIGCYEGMSAVWWLENVLTHPTSSLTLVDALVEPEAITQRLHRNLLATGQIDRLVRFWSSSQKIVPRLAPDYFDVAYVDGSHEGRDVLLDGLNCLRVVRPGGWIIFDDYEYPHGQVRPGVAIDAFLMVCAPWVEVVHRGWQLIVKRVL